MSQIQSDVKDVKSNATNAALTTQDEQKKLSALESALGRFRWSGDVRIRGESFFQKGAVDRNRARIRLRLGLEGDPNQDFTGGLYLASGFVTGSGGTAGAVGSLANPTSANDTLSNFFVGSGSPPPIRVGARNHCMHSMYLAGVPFPSSMLRQPIHFALGAIPIWLPMPSSPIMVPVVWDPCALSSQGKGESLPQGLPLLSWMESCQL